MQKSSVRIVERVITAHRQREGGGFLVRRPFPTAGYSFADPFLMLDELGPVDYAPGEAIGAPDHPHRGFETVTYILEGEGAHADSAGHRGVIGPGDVQWMTAGRGVIHSEMPSAKLQKEGGRMHGFQLWVNLPAADKMMAPRYQEIPRARIPQAQTADGLAQVRVVAGEALGARAVIETRTPIAYHDWTLRPGAAVDVPLPRRSPPTSTCSQARPRSAAARSKRASWRSWETASGSSWRWPQPPSSRRACCYWQARRSTSRSAPTARSS